MFTPTKFHSAEDKQKFAEHFKKFVKSGFKGGYFNNKFYQQLSNCFGFIAHYNREGFWAEYFAELPDKIRFVQEVLLHPCYGDPAFTFSDVEKHLQKWIHEEDTLVSLLAEQQQTEAKREIAELKRLQKKYPHITGDD